MKLPYKLISLCLAGLIFATPAHALAAQTQDEGGATTYKRKLRTAAEKEAAQREKLASEERKKQGLMPYFVEADKLAAAGDYAGAAAKLDSVLEKYPDADWPPLTRWRAMYHYRAGNFKEVVFLLKSRNDIGGLYAHLLAGAYRQLGLPKNAQAVLDVAETRLPREFKVPKRAPEIASLEDIDKKYAWFAGMLIYYEKAILAYSSVNDTHDAGKIVQAVDEYWQCVPAMAGPDRMPLNDVYGMDLSDMAMVTGFVLLAAGDIKEAKGMLTWYVKNRKPQSELDKRIFEEGQAILQGLNDQK